MYEVTAIYGDKEPKDGRLLDDYSIFRYVYDIKSYPSFLVLDSKGEYYLFDNIPIEELKEYLLMAK